MTEYLTAAQMRAIETAAIEQGIATGRDLMERAGAGVVDAILRWQDADEDHDDFPPDGGDSIGFLRRKDDDGLRAVVLCGPGNNGGDGYVIARLLHGQGWAVDVFAFGDRARLPEDARHHAGLWEAQGPVAALSDLSPDRLADAPLVVDALFGTGLTRPIPDEVVAVLMMTAHCPRVAVDLPSGLCSDRGIILAAHDLPPAHLTVTFHRAKLGHVLADGPAQCGALEVVSIGIDDCGIDPFEAEDVVQGVTLCDLGKHAGHKYDYGHALILSGGVGKGGAARLAARGALRVGAGAVTVGCPPDALAENAAQLTAIMLRALPDAKALGEALEDARLNALCVGPGLGTDWAARELVATALEWSGTDRALVLDADALTLVAGDQNLRGLLHDNCVLTPHQGEFGRLFPDLAARLDRGKKSEAKTEIVRLAAAEAGCVVLLKGPDTVIAHPDGRVVLHAAAYDRAAPWLATAGSGDVLAGFVTGLLARGNPPLDAAQTAAWLHTECALFFGPGLIAEDLPEELPNVLRNMVV